MPKTLAQTNIQFPLAVNKGGTGQTSYTNGQLLIGNTTGNTLAKATLTGTANQVVVTNSTGSITLSTPQDINTSSSPTFVGLTLTGDLSVQGNTTIGNSSSNTVTVNADMVGNLEFTKEANHNIQIATSTTTNLGGGVWVLVAGASNGSGLGGGVEIRGGSGGSTGAGGQALVKSGAGGATSGNSGDVVLQVGNKTSGTFGNILFKINSTEYARVNNDGRFGIGNTSPGSDLGIGSYSPVTNFYLSVGGNSSHTAALMVLGSGAGTGADGTISSGTAFAQSFFPDFGITGNLTAFYGTNQGLNANNTTASAKTITNTYGHRTSLNLFSPGGGAMNVTSSYGYYVGAPFNGGGGTITNNYAIVTESGAGNSGFKITTPTHTLQLGDDDAAKTTTTTWTTTSDRRTKTNIAPFTQGLDIIKQMNPVSFEYNGLGGTTEGAKSISLVAQDIMDIAPYLVRTRLSKLNEDDTDDTEIYDFNPHGLFFVLINAVKELSDKIDQLSSGTGVSVEALDQLSPVVDITSLISEPEKPE